MNRNIHFNLEMLNIHQVSSFTYVIAPFNRGESFNSLLNEVSNCPFDLLILGNLSRNLLTQNLFHSSSLPLKDKLIIGYVDIGSSTSLVTSQYLGISNSTQIPSWFGNYESGYINSNPIFSLTTVQYWQPQWLNVIKQQIDDQINAILNEAYRYSTSILEIHKGSILYLAKRLASERILHAETIRNHLII